MLGSLTFAKAAGAATALLSCVALEHTPPGCDHLIVLGTGPELLTGSTRMKAGSATKLALNTITTTAFVRLGKVYGNLMVDLRATNDKLADRAIRILIQLCSGLTRQAAATVLERAGGDLKTAIIMERLDMARDTAQVLLQEHDGRLRPILESQAVSCGRETPR